MSGKSLRLTYGYISLRRLYQYYLAGEKGLEGLSQKTARRYAEAAQTLTGGIEEGLGFKKFKDRLAHRILEELGVGKAVELLWEKKLPANPQTLASALSQTGVEANVTTARALLSLLRSLGVLQTRPLPVLTRSPKERLYEYVLSRGSVRYRKIESIFDDARRLVLELVADGRLGVRLGRKALSLSGVTDWDDAVEDVPAEFLEEWTDMDGVVRKKIVIPGDAIVHVVPG